MIRDEDKMTREYGELQIKFGMLEGPGANITKELLRKLVRQIVVRSTKYFDEAQQAGEPDHVFIYSEKQFHSVVCPAIADVTPYFLIENPLYRKPAGEEEYSGSVDYWIFYKNYSFMMELKHSYFAYTQTDNPRKAITQKFSEALQQLKEIRKDECRSLTYGNGLRKIALETIVFYRESEEENKLKADARNENFRVLFKKLLRNTELRNKSNFYALWILNKKLVTSFKYKDTFEIYPAIAFVGYISDIVN